MNQKNNPSKIKKIGRRIAEGVDIKALLFFINLFNIFDAALTLFWISEGVAEELNPLMLAALDHGAPYFLLVKISLVGLGTLLIWKQRKYCFAKLVAIAAFICYLALCFYHVLGFYLALS